MKELFDTLDFEVLHHNEDEQNNKVQKHIYLILYSNSATLSEFLKHKDRDVRKQAYHHFFKEYKKFENVFAATLSGIMEKDAFYANVRNFNDPLENTMS